MQLFTSISGIVFLIAALLHVDNADLYALNSRSHSTEEITNKVQNLLGTWDYALKILKGSLKLPKCY